MNKIEYFKLKQETKNARKREKNCLKKINRI